MKNQSLIISVVLFFFSTYISSTATELEVLLTELGLLVFCISEDHDRVNPQDGGNRPCIKKVAEILKRSTETSGIKYRVLIEKTKRIMWPDFLSHLSEKIEHIPGVTIENIETRTFSFAASVILETGVTGCFSWCYKENAREGAARQREEDLRTFRCDIGSLTFEDVLNEFKAQKEVALRLCAAWPTKEVTSPPEFHHLEDRCFYDLLDGHDKAVQRLEALLREYGIDPKSKIFEVGDSWGAIQDRQDNLRADNLFDSSQEEYLDATNRLKKLGKEIDAAQNYLFDFFLKNRLIQLQRESGSNERVIVIAGGGHIADVVLRLKRHYRFKACIKLRGSHQQGILSYKDFELLEKPLAFFKEEQLRFQAAWEEALRSSMLEKQEEELRHKSELIVL